MMQLGFQQSYEKKKRIESQKRRKKNSIRANLDACQVVRRGKKIIKRIQSSIPNDDEIKKMKYNKKIKKLPNQVDKPNSITQII